MKIQLVLAAGAALVLAGCGGTEEPAATSGAAGAAPVSIEETGRRHFAQCAVCHSVKGPDETPGPALIGPNLYGVYGAAAGSVEGFNYSDAVRNSGVTWDEETLDAFIERPSNVIRGSRMAFAGVHDPDAREAIIAYLKSKS